MTVLGSECCGIHLKTNKTNRSCSSEEVLGAPGTAGLPVVEEDSSLRDSSVALTPLARQVAVGGPSAPPMRPDAGPRSEKGGPATPRR